ncbi:hypothetical protein N7481_004705 [Penicillium waksmanii]|uniref:uncharacterized protein n=1 Tax=Penicillium waksmanii TaxID=69791 RepID=UPI00254728C6|nr:uncharacterized protein N7481_004705 [Penicillium waksmanii]KAJ5989495.1 hypothetical protein N7481_004705 [Penicillium waksmanii]
MGADHESLYGQPKKKSKNELSSVSGLSFAGQMSSLIANSNTSGSTSNDRTRRSRHPKSDLFGKQNKGAEKRAAADLEETDHHVAKQVHMSSKDIGSIDDATLNRSKQKMEKKVRMYNDMRKGMYLGGDSSDEGKPGPSSHSEEYLGRLRRREKEGLIDFDRKWANEEKKKAEGSGGSGSESEDDDNASIISYEDEFGRSRRGTRSEAAQAYRTKDEEARGEAAQERWRPNRPENLIYGEAVQSQAFNPEANIAAQMAQLAARRDRSATPPDQVHYDADGEVRNRGTGFYAFSRDEETRKKQMEELKGARVETLRERERIKERAAIHQAKIAERKSEIAQLRAKRLTAKFMNELEGGAAAGPSQPPVVR